MTIFVLRFIVVIIGAVIFATLAFSQPPPASTAQTASQKPNTDTFESLEAGFSIDLSRWGHSYGSVKPTEGISKGGSSFSWRGSDGVFDVSYDDLLKVLDAQPLIASAAEAYSKDLIAQGAKLISNDSKSFDGKIGREMLIKLSSGSSLLTRYILINDRVFVLRALWTADKDGAREIKALDSFKTLNSKEVIAKRLEKATPAALPQTPEVKKKRSDAADDGLKGRVKTVSLSTEYPGTNVPALMKSDELYDESGNKIKEVSYDYRGNPSDIKVYGFIDEKRVSNSGYISYEYDPPPPMAAPSAKATPKPPSDPRYGFSYEYKYDEKGV